MSRIEKLKTIINNGKENSDNIVLFEKLIEELIFIENQLIELRKLPFISVNPKNNYQQKATPAAKQYKELLQQYNNCIKVLAKASGQDIDDEESPLRKWVRDRQGD